MRTVNMCDLASADTATRKRLFGDWMAQQVNSRTGKAYGRATVTRYVQMLGALEAPSASIARRKSSNLFRRGTVTALRKAVAALGMELDETNGRSAGRHRVPAAVSWYSQFLQLGEVPSYSSPVIDVSNWDFDEPDGFKPKPSVMADIKTALESIVDTHIDPFERCDRCNARAYMLTSHVGGNLAWCAHHGRAIAEQDGVVVIADARHVLITAK